MEINLEGQVLVLDEAHNIEDCARESASFTVDQNSLLMCRDELDSMITNKIRASQHEPLRDFCFTLIRSVKLGFVDFACLCYLAISLNISSDVFLCSWIQGSQSLMSDRGYESGSKVWRGKDILGTFDSLGITAGTFGILKVITCLGMTSVLIYCEFIYSSTEAS